MILDINGLSGGASQHEAARGGAAFVSLGARGEGEWTGLLGLNFDSDVPIEQRAMSCPSGYITGLTVRHGRNSKTDQDMYDFRLK